MSAPPGRRLRSVPAIAGASLVLGVATTAGMYAAQTSSGPVVRPYSSTGLRGMPGPGMAGPGMTGHYPATVPSCDAPSLPGAVVDITLTDMGPMMGPAGMHPDGTGQYRWPRRAMMGMMRVVPAQSTVPAGQVSFRVLNAGWIPHELVVLALPQGQGPGQRTIGGDGKVDEGGSFGEASRTCGAGAADEASSDDGIAPGEKGWTTTTLSPGRYELICNYAGHYGAGMYSTLGVTPR